MGLKKYEIITVGSDKRVRALRSWRVQDRYVNIGDVGGIVYDEKTLSQDGACWLFRGNFNFPGARIGGDSIVDVGEAAPAATGSPNLDILGTSTVVGAPVRFSSDQTTAGAVTLTASYFEQGTFANYANGQAPGTSNSANYIRTKNPIFMGGVATTLKLDVPGYRVLALVLDRDGLVITGTSETASGVGVTLTVPAGQYFVLRVTKDPVAAIVPADATAAQIIMTAVFETKLVVVDSRVEVNAANATGVTTIKPGGTYVPAPGVKYPEAVIRNSKVSINVPMATSRTCRLMAQIIGSTAALDAMGDDVSVVGQYSNVKNITVSGVRSTGLGLSAYNIIQVTDCNNFKNDPAVISYADLVAAQTANMPFIFQGCNVPDGRFYHHAQIANTYKNIDFALATKDLGKSIGGDAGKILVSSEVNGMYRGYGISLGIFGPLIESAASVVQSALTMGGDSYATTIYADAYLNGAFDFRGANVFGGTMKHESSNTQNVRAVQGKFNATTVGGTISGIVASGNWVAIAVPFRLNSPDGIKITNSEATPYDTIAYAVDANDKIVAVSTKLRGDRTLPAFATHAKVYVAIQKVDQSPITPDDVKGITVTTYNGCKIVNTGGAAATIAGNVRVEDNSTLIDTSVTGTGYFGGNSIAQGLTVEGVVYMKDNAVFAPTISGTPKANILHMTDNASFTGAWTGAGTRLVMSGNTRFDSATNHNTSGIVEMRDNASVSGSGSVSVSGVLVLEDDASIAGGNASISGDITLCGKYKQTAAKTWTGKRVIASQDAPKYDDNVKTQYDF